MKLFGVEPPAYMQGQAIFANPASDGTVRGPLDPATLNQSGVAPGARVTVPDKTPPAAEAVASKDASR